MLGHWFVVASQKTTQIFTEGPQRGKLKLVKLFDNPLGRERNRALVRKQAGVGIKNIGRIGAVHFLKPKRNDPHEQSAIQFARQIVQFLEEERVRKNFETLTVVAEPNFLGKLRAEMKSKTETSVVDWIKKDLQKIPASKLPEMLKLKQRKRKEVQPNPGAWTISS